MPLAGMSSAELAALREAYADAEEWMLEGVCASLDGLRGDRAGVRETLGSFLGELDGETMETLADAWAPRAREGGRSLHARVGAVARSALPPIRSIVPKRPRPQAAAASIPQRASRQ